MAIEDERIQRVKQAKTDWHAQPARDAMTYCLEAAAVELGDLDGIFCCDDLERPSAWLDWDRVTFLNHHTCHAAASFFTSPYERSTLLVVDGHGSPLSESERGFEVETISTGWAEPGALVLEPLQTGTQVKTSGSWRHVTQNSVGWFYEIVTMGLGFGDSGQGKTMGLAAYGGPALLSALTEFVEIRADGRFAFDPYGGVWDWLTRTQSERPNSMQARADIAYAAQEIFVEAVLAAAKAAYERAPSPVLSFGGGCALNTIANSKILEETPFEELAVFPASGDNGLSVGAAFYGAHLVLDQPPRPPMVAGSRRRVMYTGRDLDDGEVKSVLAQSPVASTPAEDPAREIAQVLADGEVVAVCRGRSEIGPRALGNRSLLALPGSARLRDHINVNLKNRESFRPLAPVVPVECVHDFFEGVEESPYMLLVARVREEARRILPAVTHVDGTARVQTVRMEDNPFLHRLLGEVGRLTGVPVLLNTSLNLRGMPMVETAADAMDVFLQRPIDALLLGDWIARKYSPWAPLASLPAASQGILDVQPGRWPTRSP